METVKIKFLNNEYSIRTDAEENYVKEISKFLEEKVKKANKNNSTVKVSQAFLIASIKIVDDFFRLKREFEEFKNNAERKSRDLVELLDSSQNYNIINQTESESSILFSSD